MKPDAETAFAALLERHAGILADAPSLNDRRHHAAKKQLGSNVHYNMLRKITGRAS
jgi:hypothetical protein